MYTHQYDDDFTFLDQSQIRSESLTYYVKEPSGQIAKRVDTATALLIRSLIKIEDFVQKIISSKESVNRLMRRLPLGEIVSIVLERNRLPLAFEYSEYANLFQSACDELQFRTRLAKLPRNAAFLAAQPDRLSEIFYDLVVLIRQKSMTPEFKAKISKRKSDCYRNYLSMAEYIYSLFQYKSSLLVLRIDFHYHQEYAHSISLAEARADMTRMLRNRRANKRLFDGWVGYIIKTEYGIEKGYHFHALIFFNGADRQRGVYWADEIGRYWEEVITKKRGYAFNSNARTDLPKAWIGIGKIDRSDEAKLKNLLYVVRYLTKAEQFIRLAKTGTKGKSITKGEVPVRESNAGRPRRYIASVDGPRELGRSSYEQRKHQIKRKIAVASNIIVGQREW